MWRNKTLQLQFSLLSADPRYIKIVPQSVHIRCLLGGREWLVHGKVCFRCILASLYLTTRFVFNLQKIFAFSQGYPLFNYFRHAKNNSSSWGTWVCFKWISKRIWESVQIFSSFCTLKANMLESHFWAV